MIKKLLLALLEINSQKVIHHTGEKASVSGLYRNGKEIIALSKGERFPPIKYPYCWVLVVSV
jgi:hypothetical protein